MMGSIADGERGAAGAEADHELPGRRADAERRSHVVTRSRSDWDTGWQPERRRGVVPQRAGGLIRSVDLRQSQSRRRLRPDRERQQIAPLAAIPRRPPAGARGLAPVSDEVSCQPQVEPVVWQPNRHGARQIFGRGAREVGKLGDGDRGDEARPDLPTEIGHGVETFGVGSGVDVVPERRRTDDPVIGIEGDHPVLLSADTDGLDAHVG